MAEIIGNVYDTYYNTYRTRTMAQIWPTFEEFYQGYINTGLPNDSFITSENLNLVYAMLYADYGNHAISSSDENRFKVKLYTLIFIHWPTAAKKMDIQKKLRDLTEEDMRLGSKMIYNHANNPSTEPSTATLMELTQIDNQNTNTLKKSKMDAYSEIYNILDSDILTDFMERFKDLFANISPSMPLWYVTHEGE